jgi:hypothetical protein
MRSCIHSSFSSWLLSTSGTSSRRRMTRGAQVRPAALGGHEHPDKQRGSACPGTQADSNGAQQPSQPSPLRPPTTPTLEPDGLPLGDESLARIEMHSAGRSGLDFASTRSVPPQGWNRAAAHSTCEVITIKSQAKNLHTDAPTIDPPVPGRPRPVVTAVAVLMALWCIGFAVVNLVFEVTGHFASGAYAYYPSGISVMDWLVAGLKALGAAVALMSVARRPALVSPAVVTVLVWAAFATLGVYVLGSVAEAAGMGLGILGGAGQIDTRSVAYVLFFLAAAVGYGILATSYSRRHPGGRGPVILGVLGAPALLGLLLLAVPAMLAAFGLLPGH